MTVRFIGTPALALHRVPDAIGAEHLHALRTPANASALLRIIHRIFHAVVGLLTNDYAIAHEHLVYAALQAASNYYETAINYTAAPTAAIAQLVNRPAFRYHGENGKNC